MLMQYHLTHQKGACFSGHRTKAAKPATPAKVSAFRQEIPTISPSQSQKGKTLSRNSKKIKNLRQRQFPSSPELSFVSSKPIAGFKQYWMCQRLKKRCMESSNLTTKHNTDLGTVFQLGMIDKINLEDSKNTTAQEHLHTASRDAGKPYQLRLTY